MISTAATGRELRELAEEDAALEQAARRGDAWTAALCRELREHLRDWVAQRVRPQTLGVVRASE